MRIRHECRCRSWPKGRDLRQIITLRTSMVGRDLDTDRIQNGAGPLTEVEVWGEHGMLAICIGTQQKSIWRYWRLLSDKGRCRVRKRNRHMKESGGNTGQSVNNRAGCRHK